MRSLISDNEPGKIGLISWADLTVSDATQAMNFYRQVTGWQVSEFDMGGYSDYCMNEPGSGKTVVGICHARGGNVGLPPVWLLYITVANLDESISKCKELGGEVIAGPKSYGDQGRYCVIKDPAGAAVALFEQSN